MIRPLIQGFATTFKHIFRKPVTVNYPDQKIPVFPKWRGKQVLIGMSFAGIFFAYAATLKSEAGFAVIYRLLVMPLFLFSGAFFPVANLSAPLELLAKLTPLWHGVDLTRMLVLDRVDGPLALVHVAYLVVLSAVGWWLAVWRLDKRLEV